MKKILLTIAFLTSFAITPFVTTTSNFAFAEEGATGSKAKILEGVNAAGGSDAGNSKDLKTTVKEIVQVILFIIGVLAVIMIIYSGFQYIISVGDSGKISKAKNTLLYSIVGLIVAIMAYAIVGFVVNAL